MGERWKPPKMSRKNYYNRYRIFMFSVNASRIHHFYDCYGLDCLPQKRCVKGLAPCTSGCDFIWKLGSFRGN